MKHICFSLLIFISLQPEVYFGFRVKTAYHQNGNGWLLVELIAKPVISSFFGVLISWKMQIGKNKFIRLYSRKGDYLQKMNSLVGVFSRVGLMGCNGASTSFTFGKGLLKKAWPRKSTACTLKLFGGFTTRLLKDAVEIWPKLATAS